RKARKGVSATFYRRQIGDITPQDVIIICRQHNKFRHSGFQIVQTPQPVQASQTIELSSYYGRVDYLIQIDDRSLNAFVSQFRTYHFGGLRVANNTGLNSMIPKEE